MKIKNTIPPAVLSAATTLLQPYAPELSPTSLVSALKTHEHGGNLSERQQCPLTRDEAAEMLKVSLPTLDRYLKDGAIRSAKIGKRLIRISPESVRAFLDGSQETHQTAEVIA